MKIKSLKYLRKKATSRDCKFKMNKMKFLIIFSTVVFVVWCAKGYWTLDPSTALLPPSSEYLSHIREMESDLEKDRLISILKAQLAHYRDKLHKCHGQDIDEDDVLIQNSLPTIYAVTPTHKRDVQKAELTRISNTLKLVPNLHWVVIEDSETKTDLVAKLLVKSGLRYTHLNIATPKNWKLKSKEPRWSKPRGVLQRNVALQWIRDNVQLDGPEGVLYFLDDDNTYSLELFDEMRFIKRVGVWPVGLVGGLLVERPRINEKGKVTGWLTVWSPERPFAIDMAGFAINLKHFLQTPDGKFAFEVEKGYQESELLKHFVNSLDELEVKAQNCTQILVWHTRTEPPNLIREKALKKAGKRQSDYGLEV